MKINKTKVIELKRRYTGITITLDKAFLFFINIQEGKEKGHYIVNIDNKTIEKLS